MKSNEKESTSTSSEDGQKKSTATSSKDNDIVNLNADDDNKSAASMDSMEHMTLAELRAITHIATNIPNKDITLTYSGLLATCTELVHTVQNDQKEMKKLYMHIKGVTKAFHNGKSVYYHYKTSEP